MAAGSMMGYYISVRTAEKMLEAQKSVIELAIRKETTSIKNEFKNEFKKIKSKKSEPINIIIDPSAASVISNKDSTQIITVEKKKGFFKRLFTKKKKEE